MNNKLFLVLSAVLVSLVIIIGCAQKTAVTAPVSNTPTQSATTTATATVTATVTATSTATASPVTVADFEGVNCYTSIVCSNCTNQVLGGMSVNVGLYARGCVALTGAPAELGSKAYSVSATALNDANTWFAIYPATLSATGVGSDFSEYNRISFAYKITTDAPVSDSILLSVILFTPDMAHSLTLEGVTLDRSGNWASVSLDLSTFTVGSSLTAAQILAQIGSIRIYFRDSGDGLSSPFTEAVVDNIRMSVE